MEYGKYCYSLNEPPFAHTQVSFTRVNQIMAWAHEKRSNSIVNFMKTSIFN